MTSIPSSKEDTFHEQLKNKTLDAHRRLEALPISKAVTSPALTNDRYAEYLLLMREVIRTTENRIFPILSQVIPDLDHRKKMQMITDDLEVIAKFDVAPKQSFKYPADNISEAMAIGILYVIEGSTLGGRYILQNVQSALGYSPGHGGSYFAGYGNKTGTHWKAFLNFVEEYERRHQCGDEIVKGANLAFTAVYDYMKGI